MPSINFNDPEWAGVVDVDLCDAGGAGNTLQDPAKGIRFIIACGKMAVVSGSSGRFLFWSQFDCTGTMRPSGDLVIRFDTPQQYVRFRFNTDPLGPAPTIVFFYAQPNGVDLIEQRNYPDAFMAINEVVFANASTPVREILVRSDEAENRFYDIEWQASLAAVRHDVMLALDGSGSMSAQNKWGAMVEAADIFHDLYRAFGDASDAFGAVRFRWSCASTVSGDQTLAQPALADLGVAVDIPALYAADGPGDCTPIGSGVIHAATQLAAGSNPVKHVLLLTDGLNNRGTAVPVASGDAALAGITVHTIGLGSPPHINPVEIAALASDHGGTFRETTEPRQILDFFAQVLGEMLGKAELAIVSGDEASIASGTSRAVFMIAWDDPAVTHDFDLRAPDGTVMDHAAPVPPAGLTAAYHPSGAGSAHAYFVVDGADLAGAWRFENAPAATTASRLAVEDLGLTVHWEVTPQLGVVGEPVTVTCRIRFEGKPYAGDALVTARVRRPDEDQGDLVAREMRRKPLALKPGGDTSAHAQVVGGVLARLGREDFRYVMAKELAFTRSGPGEYSLTYRDTVHDGPYRFELEARHDGEGAVSFARRTTRSAVFVATADGSTEFTSQRAGPNSYWVTFTPRTQAGVLAGPFLAPLFTVTSDTGRPVGQPHDELNGSYRQLFATTRDAPPEVALALRGRPIPRPAVQPAEEEPAAGSSAGLVLSLLLALLVLQVLTLIMIIVR